MPASGTSDSATVKKRTLIIPIVVLFQTAAILLAANLVLEMPSEKTPKTKPFSYAAARAMSEPAMAGMIEFGGSCAECHGRFAQGTDKGPGLLHRSYAKNFRNSERFHSAVGSRIAAHQDIIGMASGSGAVDFNSLELMGKFLREARRNQPR